MKRSKKPIVQATRLKENLTHTNVNFMIEKSIYCRLKALCNLTGMTRKEAFSEAIKEYVHNHKREI